MPDEEFKKYPVSFKEASRKLNEWVAAFSGFVMPQELGEEAREIVSDAQMMLSLGEKDFSPDIFLKLERQAGSFAEKLEEELGKN